jgi:hypothetical protein
LITRASVIVTGLAKSNAVLSRNRTRTVANYLSSSVKVNVTLKSVTGAVTGRATVTSTNQ